MSLAAVSGLATDSVFTADGIGLGVFAVTALVLLLAYRELLAGARGEYRDLADGVGAITAVLFATFVCILGARVVLTVGGSA